MSQRKRIPESIQVFLGFILIVSLGWGLLGQLIDFLCRK